MTETATLWEQDTATETAKAYAAFCRYRDMGPRRSLLGAYRQETGKEQAKGAPGLWTGWYQRNEWKKRALAYDAHLELAVRRQDEAAHVAELVAYREKTRHAADATYAIAHHALLLTGQTLQAMKPGDLTPAMIPGYLRAAAAVMEASLNAEAEAIGVRRLETLLDEADSCVFLDTL